LKRTPWVSDGPYRVWEGSAVDRAGSGKDRPWTGSDPGRLGYGPGWTGKGRLWTGSGSERIGYGPDRIRKGSAMGRIGSSKDQLWTGSDPERIGDGPDRIREGSAMDRRGFHKTSHRAVDFLLLSLSLFFVCSLSFVLIFFCCFLCRRHPWAGFQSQPHRFEIIRGDQLALPTRCVCVHHFGVGIGYVPDGIMKGSVMDRVGSGKDRLWTGLDPERIGYGPDRSRK
jgi:hypothetical protein